MAVSAHLPQLNNVGVPQLLVIHDLTLHIFADLHASVAVFQVSFPADTQMQPSSQAMPALQQGRWWVRGRCHL